MISFFQQNGNYVSKHCLKNLESFRRICEEVEIDFFISLFTGWMSGFSFIPAYTKNYFGKSIFMDKDLIQFEKNYINEVAKVIADSKKFLGFDWGNEISAIASKDFDTRITKNGASSWTNEMFAACETVAPNKLHGNGVDHVPWFYDNVFSRENLANSGDITPLHCWTEFTGALKRYRLCGVGSINKLKKPEQYSIFNGEREEARGKNFTVLWLTITAVRTHVHFVRLPAQARY